MSVNSRAEEVKSALLRLFSGPQLLAFLPALTLAGYWYGGEAGLIVLSLALPLVMAGVGMLRGDLSSGAADDVDAITGFPTRAAAVRLADQVLGASATRLETTAVLAIGIDEFPEITARHGFAAGATILQACAERLTTVMRDTDTVVRLEGPNFGVVATSSRRADLETLIQLSSRIQRSLEDPIVIEGVRIFVTASVGFATPRKCSEPTGAAIVEAAEDALGDAMANGTGMIRAFSPEIQARTRERTALAADLPHALESDQIKPFFQPQIAAATGEVTGFEVLARWYHPERGLVPPGEFLSAAEQQGLLERLGEVMLYSTLNSLRAWDAAGLDIPNLSVNFSAEELRNPAIVDKIRWELDRFEVAPARLTVEVLETVIAQTANDTIIRNLRALSELGCKIDLDDFGTGHASIAAIKRFSVQRIKIDRSFVTQLDTDLDQQNIVAAILTMAQRLELETLAEGVETSGEHAVLRRLGCDMVQGYGIARPMPFEDVETWMNAYSADHDRPAGAAAEGQTDRAGPAVLPLDRDAAGPGRPPRLPNGAAPAGAGITPPGPRDAARGHISRSAGMP